MFPLLREMVTPCSSETRKIDQRENVLWRISQITPLPLLIVHWNQLLLSKPGINNHIYLGGVWMGAAGTEVLFVSFLLQFTNIQSLD